MAKRTAYHHGNVRTEALAAARQLLESEGLQAVSVRAIATKLGVAHRALYNHFENRDSLLAAVAAEGFLELRKTLTHARSIKSFLTRYTEFALDKEALYNLMMSQQYSGFESNPALRDAADAMISVALRCLAPTEASDDERRREVMRYWMLAHGAIGLHCSGMLKSRPRNEFLKELLIVASLEKGAAGSSQELWKNNDSL